MIEHAEIRVIFHDIENHQPKDERTDAVAALFNFFLDGLSLKDDNGDLWQVERAACGYQDDLFFSVNIYLKGYDANNYFMYGDKTMEEQLQKALPFLYLTYSESGMQGDDYINLDVWVAKDYKGTK